MSTPRSGNTTMRSLVGVAGAQVGRFLKSHRVLYVPAGWVSRIVGLSPSTSFIAVLLGPLRARLRGSMSADDVLRVLRALDTRSLPYWLAGGWGIDALIGKQNRTHDDLDVIIDDYQRNAPAAPRHFWILGSGRSGPRCVKPGCRTCPPSRTGPVIVSSW